MNQTIHTKKKKKKKKAPKTYTSYIMLFKNFWLMCDLIPQSGTELTPPALAAQSLYPWTTREVPITLFMKFNYIQNNA